MEKFVADNIKIEMAKLGLNKSQVARRCGYPRSTVDNYLAGRYPVPLHFMEAFCRIYHIEVGTLSCGFEACQKQRSS